MIKKNLKKLISSMLLALMLLCIVTEGFHVEVQAAAKVNENDDIKLNKIR